MTMSKLRSKLNAKNLLGNKEICNLDCNKKKTEKDIVQPLFPQVHDFNGPVRLVLMDPPDERDASQRRIAASLISMANLAIGANFCIYLLYAMSFVLNFNRNAHLVLCIIGCQFLLPLAILIHHPLYGAAGPLSDSQRTWSHVKLIVLTTCCVGGGSYLAFIDDSYHLPSYMKHTWIDKGWQKVNDVFFYHTWCGVSFMACFGISAMTGIALLLVTKKTSLDKLFTNFHRYSGILSLILGHVTFTISLASPAFQMIMYFSAYLVPTIVMVFLVVFYTGVLLIFPGSHFKEQY